MCVCVCVWPIENPKKRGKDAARLIYEHVNKTHGSAKSREQVLTDLHQFFTCPFLLSDREIHEMNVIRDKAFAGGTVNSTNQLLNAALDSEAAHGNGKGNGSTPTERQLVLRHWDSEGVKIHEGKGETFSVNSKE